MFKNIDYQTVFDLESQVTCVPGQITSNVIIKNKLINITLFAIAMNEGLGEHTSTGEALLFVLSGTMKVRIYNKVDELHAGQSILLPANMRHSVKAIKNLKMLLVISFSQDDE